LNAATAVSLRAVFEQAHNRGRRIKWPIGRLLQPMHLM